jgi:uncharacterized protein (DUF2235 family)
MTNTSTSSGDAVGSSRTPDTPRESRNIVICSDGTGNAGGRFNGTNVWRIRQAVAEKAKQPTQAGQAEKSTDQVVIYQDGVGTERFRPMSIVGLVFSYGMTKDLETLYSRLIQVYEPGDRMYFFGFSRGAFTIRTLAYVLDRCGIADRRDDNGNLHTPERIQELAHKAVDAYKFRHVGDDKRFRLKYGRQRGLGGDESQGPSEDEIGRFPIEFIGVWDTVAAVGLPFRNVTQALCWCWRKVTSFRFLRWARFSLLNFHRPTGHENQPGAWRAWEDDDLHPRIRNAFHAISIDDKRQTFYPLLWLEFDRSTGMRKAVSDRERVSLTAVQREGLAWETRNVQQVWFAGMHSNVGGGYAKDHMSFVSLEWMMAHAARAGLAFNQATWNEYHHQRDEMGKMYDSRSGLATYYRYRPRVISDFCRKVGIDGSTDDRLPLIHSSVFNRIAGSTLNYAPGGVPLPGEYSQVGVSQDIQKTIAVRQKTVISDVVQKMCDDELSGREEVTRALSTARKQLKGQADSDAAASALEITPSSFRHAQPVMGSLRAGTQLEHAVPESGALSGPASSVIEEQWWQQKLQTASTEDRVEWGATVAGCHDRTRTIREETRQYAEGYVMLSRGAYYCFFLLTLAFVAAGIWQPLITRLQGFEDAVYGFLSIVCDMVPVLPVLVVVALPAIVVAMLYGVSVPFKNRCPEVRMTLIGVICGVVMFMLRPSFETVLLWFSPGFVADLVGGVCGSPMLFTLLTTLLCLNLQASALFRGRIQEWNAYGWRASLSMRVNRPRKISHDSLARFLASRGWGPGLIDRFVVPAVAIGLLLIMLSYPLWLSLEDVLVRMTIKRTQTELGVGTPATKVAWGFEFDTDSVLATGVELQAGQTYRISIRKPKGATQWNWKDGAFTADPNGIRKSATMPMRLASPLKRSRTLPYLGLCGTIGDHLDTVFPIDDGQSFTAITSGELFVFVNDVPGMYYNNQGTGLLTVEHLHCQSPSITGAASVEP